MKLRAIIASVLLFALGLAAGVWLSPRLHNVAFPGMRPHPEHAAPVDSDGATTWYTCGMHPEVVQDHPGDCPKCGMRLRPMSPDRAAAMGLDTGGGDPTPAAKKGERKIAHWRSPMVPGEIHTDPGADSMGHDLVPVYRDEVAAGTIRIDPVTEQNMGIRVSQVTSGPVRRTVRTVGFVDYDETALAAVATKVDGWVEKLHVDQTGAQVHRGDPLFDVYSPALFSAQEEYLAALRGHQRDDLGTIPRAQFDSAALVRDARTRLEFFDVSDAQIRALERTGTVRKALTIRSPFTGIITDKNVVEGQRIEAGKTLFRIADVSTVWVIGKVFESDLQYVELGQDAFVTLGYAPGKTFRGRVTYVYPYLEKNTREIPVRMEFHNPGYDLKPGMYATITLTREVAERATLVPDVAVINTGLRHIAFVVREPGRYELREVEVGARTDDNHVQVLSGLAPDELVVVSGQFLLDSESRLREASLKFMDPGLVDAATPIESATEGATATSEGRLYYVCPMPEHVDILYDHAGACPLCGMKLIPVRREAGQVQDATAGGGDHVHPR
jgi:Cu(I)/Ag(I) efflux system membrane fusion protein/cobalt-zinc-cadmium efflux system membrane fusion protein